MVRTLILLLLLPLHSKQFAAGRLLRTGEKVPEKGKPPITDDLLACGYPVMGTNSSASAEKASMVDRDKFPFCHVLSTGQVALYWTHDGYHRQRGNASAPLGAGDNMTFVLAARTMSSWLALGLSRDGTGMKGMDVALLLRDDDDAASFRLEDRHSLDYVVPALDQRQDKTLLWAKQAHGVTSFAFTMPVSNCMDVEQDVGIAQDRFTHVMYAYGSSTRAGFGDHGQDNRGAATLPLLLSDAAELSRLAERVSLPPDAKVIDIKVNEVPLSTERTTNYWCVWVEMPSDGKYHVYDAELISDPRTAGMVHHVSLRDCNLAAPARALNEPFECLEIDGGCPIVATYDRNVTVPSSAVLAKAGAAWPFGANVSRFWRLEVHVENAALLPGLRDSTGFRITYSPTLRPHDLGFLFTGAIASAPSYNLTSDLILPPGHAEYDYVNVCPSSCTKRLLPQSGVTVLNAHLHMHGRGLGGSIEVVRANGSKVPIIWSTHYDGNAQPNEPLLSPVHLLPGDRLVATCVYNTTGAKDNVVWGTHKDQEMCMGTLYFYPADISLVCTNLQGVRHPVLDWLIKADPSKSYALCTKGTVTKESSARVEACALVPHDEQQWQKEGRGKALKMTELKALSRSQACGA